MVKETSSKNLYRKRVFRFIFLLNIALQSVLVLVGVSQYLRFETDANDNLNAKQAQYFANEMSFLDTGATWFLGDFANNSGLTEYVFDNMALRSKAVAAQELHRKAVAYIAAHPEIGWYIDGAYFMGRNFNQKSFRFTSTGGTSAFDATLLNAEEFAKHINFNFNVTNFFRFDRERHSFRHTDDPVLQKKLDDFADFADGRILYMNYGGQITVVAVNEDYLRAMKGAAELTGSVFTVLNNSDEVVYTLEEDVAAGDIYAGAEGSVIVRNPPLLSDFRIWLVLGAAALLFACFTVLSYLQAGRFADMVLRPYKGIKSIFNLHYDNSLAPIEIFDDNVPHSKKSFIQKNIYNAVIYAVVLPNLLFGMIFLFMYQSGISDTKNDYAKFIERHMAIQTRITADKIIKQSPPIARQDFQSIITALSMRGSIPGGQWNTPVTPEQIIISDADGRILQNTIRGSGSVSGAVIEQAMKSKLYSAKGETYIAAAEPDLFGAGNFFKINCVRGDDGSVLGYWCILTPSSEFREAQLDPKIEFYLADTNGIPICASDADYAALRRGELFEKVPNARLIGSSVIEPLGWELVTTINNAELYYESLDVLMRGTLIILAVLILTLIFSWRFSFSFAAPMERIAENLRSGNIGGVSPASRGVVNDEISEVIAAYNMLICRLKELMEEQRKFEMREHELMTLNAQAEFNVLQQQINPHFLYNTLELVNLQALCAGNNEASEVIVSLTQMMKYSLSKPGATVALEDEIEHIKNYLKIQQSRFPSLFTCELNIAEDTKGIQVIKMILQPIVENAILHGFKGRLDGGELRITSSLEGGTLTVEVSDNGVGMSAERLSEVRRRIGQSQQDGSGSMALRNINKRLTLVSNGSRLEISSEMMKGTSVRVIYQVQGQIENKE